MPLLQTWNNKKEITVTTEKTYKRFTLKTILTEILDVLMVNKGIFYTLKQLTVSPGETLRGYLETEREKITSPAKYFVIMIGVFYFIYFRFTHTSYVEDYLDELDGDQIQELSYYFQVYFLDQLSIWSALAIFFFAWMGKIFYKKHQLNYIEHFILHTYVNAQVTFYKLILLPAVYLIGYSAYNYIEILITPVYYYFVLHHFFREKPINTLYKTILVFGLGYILFIILIGLFWVIFGFIIGLIQAYEAR